MCVNSLLHRSDEQRNVDFVNGLNFIDEPYIVPVGDKVEPLVDEDFRIQLNNRLSNNYGYVLSGSFYESINLRWRTEYVNMTDWQMHDIINEITPRNDFRNIAIRDNRWNQIGSNAQMMLKRVLRQLEILKQADGMSMSDAFQRVDDPVGAFWVQVDNLLRSGVSGCKNRVLWIIDNLAYEIDKRMLSSTSNNTSDAFVKRMVSGFRKDVFAEITSADFAALAREDQELNRARVAIEHFNDGTLGPEYRRAFKANFFRAWGVDNINNETNYNEYSDVNVSLSDALALFEYELSLENMTSKFYNILSLMNDSEINARFEELSQSTTISFDDYIKYTKRENVRASFKYSLLSKLNQDIAENRGKTGSWAASMFNEATRYKAEIEPWVNGQRDLSIKTALQVISTYLEEENPIEFTMDLRDKSKHKFLAEVILPAKLFKDVYLIKS